MKTSSAYTRAKVFIAMLVLTPLGLFAQSQNVHILMQKNIFDKLKKAPKYSLLQTSHIKKKTKLYTIQA